MRNLISRMVARPDVKQAAPAVLKRQVDRREFLRRIRPVGVVAVVAAAAALEARREHRR